MHEQNTPAVQRLARAEGIRWLHPGYLALVMATGIISTAAQMFGLTALSNGLLAVAIGAYAVLVPLYLYRLIRFTAEFRADLRHPGRGFGFFTVVAASNVLAIRLSAAGAWWATETLWAVALLAWLVLTYLIPAGFYLRTEKVPFRSVNGVWLVWVVGTQSVAAASATVALHRTGMADGLAALAVSLWAVGVLLYIILMAMIMARMFFYPVEPGDLLPPYWITMGACAITVIAGARILALPPALPMMQATRPVVEGISLMLWAWGTWWIPMLVILGSWRHLLKRDPIRYDPTYWSMVFPLGMYGASSATLGHSTGFTFLTTFASYEIWVAVAAWAATFSGMLASWRRRAA
ncbi:MAG: tellurite resistance/C4-dicarboxylate transporter family protein [Mycobacterium leprae]